MLHKHLVCTSGWLAQRLCPEKWGPPRYQNDPIIIKFLLERKFYTTHCSPFPAKSTWRPRWAFQARRQNKKVLIFAQAERQNQMSALKKENNNNKAPPYLYYLGQSTTICHLKEEKYVSQLVLILTGHALKIHESFQTGQDWILGSLT